MTEKMRVLSMGAGVQTTALLLHDQKYDLVIFADPGSEWPQTYEYVEKYLKPFCQEHDLKFVTVKNEKFGTLQKLMEHYRGPPDVRTRSCTDNFKVRPIKKYMKANYNVSAKNPYTLVLGISYDEAHRANMSQRVKYELREFPLVDSKITRIQCENIIKDHGWPVPVKSGCDFCPFQNKHMWRKLQGQNPERFKELVKLEKTFTNNMTFSLSGKSIAHYAQSQSLDDFETCESGHCFT